MQQENPELTQLKNELSQVKIDFCDHVRQTQKQIAEMSAGLQGNSELIMVIADAAGIPREEVQKNAQGLVDSITSTFSKAAKASKK